MQLGNNEFADRRINMSSVFFEVTGRQVGRWYECQHNSAHRQLNHTQFLVLLELILAAFERQNGWLPLKLLRAAADSPENGRKYIERLRDELQSRELIESDFHGHYRLSIPPDQVGLGAALWKLPPGELDAEVITRLKLAYYSWQNSRLGFEGDDRQFRVNVVTGASWAPFRCVATVHISFIETTYHAALHHESSYGALRQLISNDLVADQFIVSTLS